MLLAWRMQLVRPSWPRVRPRGCRSVWESKPQGTVRSPWPWTEKRTVTRQPAETNRGVTNATRVCAVLAPSSSALGCLLWLVRHSLAYRL